jgi:CO/xanthine dehydrogenase FAD-binding subunit
MYAEFDLDMPETLADALEALAGAGGREISPLAGGTNLIVDIRVRREWPERVVSLGKIAELRGIRAGADMIEIGARTSVSDLLASPEIAVAAPSLLDAARVFAGQMVRNTATVAGNIACGSPAADLVPPLMSLDAEVTLASKAGERTVPLEEYFLGYKQDARKPDELITKIAWPCLAANAANSFYKLARRKGDAITITGVAVTLAAEGGKCSLARIALGAVAPVVLRAKKAEAMLVGQDLTSDLIVEAAAIAAGECSPIDDVRASAEYRLHTVEALTRRLLLQGWNRVKG